MSLLGGPGRPRPGAAAFATRAARLQARIALEELLARCPDFSVDAAAGEYATGNYVRRHLSLPFSTRS